MIPFGLLVPKVSAALWERGRGLETSFHYRRSIHSETWPYPPIRQRNRVSGSNADVPKALSLTLGTRVNLILGKLGKDATMCPGELSRQLLPGVEKPLTVLRPLFYKFAEEGRVRLSQGGAKTRWEKIRGPFRIRGS